MFKVNNNDIYMTEHDFNVALPVTINGTWSEKTNYEDYFSEGDNIKIINIVS